MCQLTLTIGFSYSCLNVRDVPKSLPSQAKSNNAHVSCQQSVRIGYQSSCKYISYSTQWHVLEIHIPAAEEFLIFLFISRLFRHQVLLKRHISRFFFSFMNNGAVIILLFRHIKKIPEMWS